MACLILNEVVPENGQLSEQWYDFNPEDRDTVQKIEAILAGNGPADREARNREVVALCKASLNFASPPNRSRQWLSKFLENLSSRSAKAVLKKTAGAGKFGWNGMKTNRVSAAVESITAPLFVKLPVC